MGDALPRHVAAIPATVYRPHRGQSNQSLRRRGDEGVFGVAMLRKGLVHGFSQVDWEAAKDEARMTMIERAKVRGMIPYSDLVKQIKGIKLDAHDPRDPRA